ncbi:MAG: nucleotidyltransferase family protein [Lachnospiraceae bacterium]|nr:nucleotidyltransferase family protein [Lachnospiraceae bacterium]MEE3460546.1 nucleotidyltransferase family protein [Lachnospiraceae bacterium]
MSTAGIIAEFNPFHNGHKYLFDCTRKLTGAENIVTVMSGDFVQRGAVSCADKYVRTEDALNNGADMVFQMPVRFSVSSADRFALCGVKMLDSLGFVDYISFGVENITLEELEHGADLYTSAEAYLISDRNIHDGLSFAARRQKIILGRVPEEEALLHKLSSASNILALEYIRALKKLHSKIIPVAIMRSDNGYHSSEAKGLYAPASLIRKMILKDASLSDQTGSLYADGNKINASLSGQTGSFNVDIKNNAGFNRIVHDRPSGIAGLVPDNVYKKIIKDPYQYSITNKIIDEVIVFKIMENLRSGRSLSIFEEVSDQLSDRIENMLPEYQSFDRFTELLKTRNYTYTRVSRALINIMLGIEKGPEPDLKPLEISAIRLLGLRKEKSYLLKEANVHIINKVTFGEKLLKSDKKYGYVEGLLYEDLYSSELRNKLVYIKYGLEIENDRKKNTLII